MEIKFDKRNYRKHSDKNKQMIRKSLQDCGAGRSVLVDANNELIAGNGVFEQAQKLGIPTRVVETDGSELVVVKRTDLQSDDDRRKELALADNATSDNVEWAADLLQEDFSDELLQAFNVDFLPNELDGKGEYEDTMTDYETSQILDVEDEYIIVKCKPEEFDDMRKHFGLGFMSPIQLGPKYKDRKVKQRVVNWSDYVSSNTKQK